MEPDRARELLARERARIEHGLAASSGTRLESDELREPGDSATEDLYMDELQDARRQELRQDLAALERAEARLRAGTYGRSVESGQPIPDERLEALPLAERTVEEDQLYRRG